MKKPPYQDVWRDGRLVRKGRRECAQRFADIAQRVGDIRTLVDVGGWDGYMARRFAEAGVECTLIEPRNVADLPAGVTHRQESITGTTQLERVDVILALSVLHHIDDWQDVYALLRRSCDALIVETPHPDEGDTGERVIAETKHRIVPLWERMEADGEVFATTPGPNGIDRPLFAVSNVITGTVEDGTGHATVETAERPHGWWEPLGYQPAPGTLNIRVGRAGRGWVKQLPSGVEAADTTYWPVTVGGVAGHARVTKSLATVELVAPVHLRSMLGLANGDTVEVRVR